MIEVDVRRAGRGCVDNPVAMLSPYLGKFKEIKIVMRPDQENLIREIVEVAEYRIKERGETDGDVYYIVEM